MLGIFRMVTHRPEKAIFEWHILFFRTFERGSGFATCALLEDQGADLVEDDGLERNDLVLIVFDPSATRTATKLAAETTRSRPSLVTARKGVAPGIRYRSLSTQPGSVSSPG